MSLIPSNGIFFIAEMSGNHNQSLDRALQIVDAAARAGANAIKLQTYTADSMTMDIDTPEFVIENPNSPWYGRKLHSLYKEGATPLEWHQSIFNRAKDQGIICFSTPFDDSAVDFLESLNTPIYKIASFEIVDLPLIRRCAQTGKPLIISTGMATPEEISDAVDAAKSVGCRDLHLLKCTSAYPAPVTEANLLSIPSIKRRWDCSVGLSDHTMGTRAAVVAVALGARIIEKHFTLRRADGGIDATFSMEPDEFEVMVDECREAFECLGTCEIGPSPSELPGLKRRRSLYISEDLSAGTTLTMGNLRRVRPGNGLKPKFLDSVLGRKVRVDVVRGTPLSWELID
jgi:pseudaminic acid synthase